MKRSSYSDFGITIAVALTIVSCIRAFMFGFSWGSILLLLVSLIYFLSLYFLCRKNEDCERKSKIATNIFLAASVISIVYSMAIDKNVHPKIHAFEGAAKDTVEEEEFVVVDKDIPVEIAPVDTVSVDSVAEEMVDSTMSAPALEEPVEEEEVSEE